MQEMSEKEAAEVLTLNRPFGGSVESDRLQKAIDIAINKLTYPEDNTERSCENCNHKDEYIKKLEAELNQYRQFGTVEECHTAALCKLFCDELHAVMKEM